MDVCLVTVTPDYLKSRKKIVLASGRNAVPGLCNSMSEGKT